MLTLLKKFFALFVRAPKVADATERDYLIVQTDNSGEPGMPVENQDPNYVPRGSVQ